MMRVKVPPISKVGAYSYRVVFASHIRHDDGYEASINHRKELIQIDLSVPPVRRNAVFLHEIIHLIDKVYEVGLSEEDTSRLANGLTEFLMNNLGVDFDWGLIKSQQSE